ncbi:MAG: YgiQ family radical SAM protein, partial [Spirochaetales bacterium]|nr:YgiQ family radical SAM protein [Spirochaetales bacterium]
TVRRSILLDSKADILVHGMAERQVVAIARRLSAGEDARAIRGLRGTAWWTSKEADLPADAVRLPAFAEVSGTDGGSLRAFAQSFATQYRASDPWNAKALAEEAEGRFVVVEPPEFPLARAELDRVWALPFERRAHPLYERSGGVPALSEVKFSVAATRGCFGACAFCAIAFHQGRVPSSRSRGSIVAEVEGFRDDPDWKGIVHDVGGPTANFLGPACAKQSRSGPCPERRCLSPEPCPALEVDHGEWLGNLRALRALDGVRKVFVRSGIRFDHLMLDRDPLVLRELAEHHVSGQLKVAPEHVSDRVLALMGKPPHRVFEAFAAEWRRANDALGKKQFLVPYFIASHPGATLDDAIELALWLADYGFVPDQVQDFYPTPGTLATAMYRTGLDPLTLESVHVARGERERAMQRALLQFDRPENRATVLEALRVAGRADLAGRLLGKGAGERSGKRRP